MFHILSYLIVIRIHILNRDDHQINPVHCLSFSSSILIVKLSIIDICSILLIMADNKEQSSSMFPPVSVKIHSITHNIHEMK